MLQDLFLLKKQNPTLKSIENIKNHIFIKFRPLKKSRRFKISLFDIYDQFKNLESFFTIRLQQLYKWRLCHLLRLGFFTVKKRLALWGQFVASTSKIFLLNLKLTPLTLSIPLQIGTVGLICSFHQQNISIKSKSYSSNVIYPSLVSIFIQSWNCRDPKKSREIQISSARLRISPPGLKVKSLI